MTASVSSDPVAFFPRDLAIVIFECLDSRHLGICCQVSQSWRKLASSDEVWRHIAQAKSKNEIPFKIDVRIKDMLSQFHLRTLRTNDEIIDKLQAFLKKCSVGRKCLFRCVFEKGKHITVVIKNEDCASEDIFREEYVCENKLGDQSLTRFDTENFSWKALTYLQNNDYNKHSEPNYSDPFKPTTTNYKKSVGSFKGIEFEVYVPWARPSPSNKLNRQIVCMVASKCNELSKRDHFSNTTTAIASLAAHLVGVAGLVSYMQFTRV